MPPLTFTVAALLVVVRLPPLGTVTRAVLTVSGPPALKAPLTATVPLLTFSGAKLIVARLAPPAIVNWPLEVSAGHAAGAVPKAARHAQRAPEGAAGEIDHAIAGQRGVSAHQSRSGEGRGRADGDAAGRCQGTVHRQRPGGDRGWAGVGIRAGKDHLAAGSVHYQTDCAERAAAGDHAAEDRGTAGGRQSRKTAALLKLLMMLPPPAPVTSLREKTCWVPALRSNVEPGPMERAVELGRLPVRAGGATAATGGERPASTPRIGLRRHTAAACHGAEERPRPVGTAGAQDRPIVRIAPGGVLLLPVVTDKVLRRGKTEVDVKRTVTRGVFLSSSLVLELPSLMFCRLVPLVGLKLAASCVAKTRMPAGAVAAATSRLVGTGGVKGELVQLHLVLGRTAFNASA